METITGFAKRINPLGRHSSFEARSFLALLGIVIVAGVTSPTAFDGSNIFFQAGNLSDVLRQVALIGIIAVGMTFVILTAGIDLSVGSLLAFSTAATAMCLTRFWVGTSLPVHLFLAVSTAVLLTTLLGTLNGVVIAKLRVQPFIVTLASMIGIRGLAKWGTHNENIDLGFGTDPASVFASIFRMKSVVIWSYIVLAAIFGVVLTRTVFGRYVRAVGDNEKAAYYSGLPIQSVKIWVYTLSGLLSGYAGVLYAAANHQGNPNAGNSYELDAIAAVVIGGTRLSGGQGSIIGTILGTLIMGVLTNMLRLNNVDSNMEMMIKAVIIVLAVVVQRERKAA
jgi:ribose transport system permease protein